MKPHLGRLFQTCLCLADRSDFAAEAHFPEDDRCRRDRTIAETRGDRRNNPQVQGRLLDPQPANDININVLSCQVQPHAFLHDSDQQGDPVSFHPIRHSPWDGKGGRRNERLQFDQNRAGTFKTGDHNGARGLLGTFGEKPCGRIGDLGQSGIGHFEDADLIGGTKAIFHGAENPVGLPLLALEIKHGIHDVFQGPGPGNRAVFRHMSDEKDRRPASLRIEHELRRYFLNLADTARRRRQMTGKGGLN